MARKAKARKDTVTPEEVEKNLVSFASDVRKQIGKRQSPKMEIPLRTLANTYFDKQAGLLRLGGKSTFRSYLNTAHTRKFMQTMLVNAEIKSIMDQKAVISIRDMYYALKHTIEGTRENTFEEQEESNPIIEDLEATLGLLREQLNLEAARRGFMVGNITLRDSGDVINARKQGSGGWGVPSRIEEDIIQFEDVEADFVLVIEKDAVFSRLNQDKFWKKHNCILVTGQGMAPRGVRRLVHRLNNEHGLDVIVFTDADAAGYYIYSVYKQGSINLSNQSHLLGTPKAKFIGLTTQDAITYDLPKNVTIKLTDWDRKRAQELLNYPWMQSPGWTKEINHMLKVGFKLEQEALTKKGIRFVSETYLPEKLKKKEFLS